MAIDKRTNTSSLLVSWLQHTCTHYLYFRDEYYKLIKYVIFCSSATTGNDECADISTDDAVLEVFGCHLNLIYVEGQ